MDRLNTQAWFSSSSRKSGSDDDLVRISDGIRGARLPIAVELGTTSITVGDLLEIRAGDVLRLYRGVDGELPILAGQRARFSGRPCALVCSFAIQSRPAPALLIHHLL